MADIVRTNRLRTGFNVKFPDFPAFDAVPFSIRIYQEMGKHDVVELTFNMNDKFYTDVFSTGTPVEIKWFNGEHTGEFYGYLSTVTTSAQKSLRNPTKMTCVGATFPLKQRGSQIWTNKTGPQICQDIAKQFKLNALITPSKVKFPQQSLVGHTYWQKLNELARRLGYAVHAVNTTIYFKTVDDMVRQFASSIPYLEFADGTDPRLYGEHPTLDYFSPTIGDFVETSGHKKTSKVLAGVNPITGKKYSKTVNPNDTGKSIRSKNKQPLFVENDPYTVTESREMTDHLAVGRASLGRLNIPANGQANGDPRIAPWRTIEVSGTGNSSDGFWLVKSAEHIMFADGRYTTQFSCLTEGTGFNQTASFRAKTGQGTPTRNVRQEIVSGVSRPSKTVLSSKGTMIKETDSGFNVTPRRWVAK